MALRQASFKYNFELSAPQGLVQSLIDKSPIYGGLSFSRAVPVSSRSPRSQPGPAVQVKSKAVFLHRLSGLPPLSQRYAQAVPRCATPGTS